MNDKDELRSLIAQLKSKFEGDEAGAGATPLVARTIALASLASDQHTGSLVRWTRVMALATILLSVATFVLAAPEFSRWTASLRRTSAGKSLSIACIPVEPDREPTGGTIVFVIDEGRKTAKVVSQLPFFSNWSRSANVAMTDDFIEIVVEDAGSKATQRYNINRWDGTARDNETVREVRGRSFTYRCDEIGQRRF